MQPGAIVPITGVAWRQRHECGLVVMHRGSNLFKAVGTFRLGGGFPYFLNRWQQQADQYRYDRDHNQKLDECECFPGRHLNDPLD
jgi:peptide methionine sulfoxide reductase MsrB